MSVNELYTDIKDSPILVYPPISSISDKIDNNKMSELLQDLSCLPPLKRKAVLYLHIPFCKTRCTFCTYDSMIAKEGDGIVQDYLNALYLEMDQYSSKKYIQGLDIDCVFIGGGSPSILTDKQLEELLSKIQGAFDLKNIQEFTIEFELRTMTGSKLEICRKYGVTRISFGWQTFAEHVRKISVLILGEKELKEKIELLKAYNYSINADLIYGLPNQTFDDWKEDIRKALEFGFTGIDLFKCENVPPAPLFELQKKYNWRIADKNEKKDMFLYAIAVLKSKGFIQDNCQHFYRPEVPTSGHLYNSYMMLSSHDTIALGPSSYGIVSDWIYKNKWNLKEYIYHQKDTSIMSNIDCAYKLTREDWIERNLVQGFSRALVLPKSLLGGALDEKYSLAMDKLKQHELVVETEDEYKLTDKANGYVFNIAQEFMSRDNKKRMFTFFLMHRVKKKRE
jgi:coproporphyrinogen III oxidase-like Fe-S oxidoreductase